MSLIGFKSVPSNLLLLYRGRMPQYSNNRKATKGAVTWAILMTSCCQYRHLGAVLVARCCQSKDTNDRHLEAPLFTLSQLLCVHCVAMEQIIWSKDALATIC